MLSTKQGSHWYHFDAFGMARPGIESTPSDPKADALPLELPGPLILDIMLTSPCNVYPLTPHFYIAKLGCTRYTLFSYFCSKTYIVGTR